MLALVNMDKKRTTLMLGIRVGEDEIVKIDAIADRQQIPPDRTTVARVALQRGLDVLLSEGRESRPALKRKGRR